MLTVLLFGVAGTGIAIALAVIFYKYGDDYDRPPVFLIICLAIMSCFVGFLVASSFPPKQVVSYIKPLSITKNGSNYVAEFPETNNQLKVIKATTIYLTKGKSPYIKKIESKNTCWSLWASVNDRSIYQYKIYVPTKMIEPGGSLAGKSKKAN